MTYLVNVLKKKGKAHIWTSDLEPEGAISIPSFGDTFCSMWSTGGLKQNRDGWEIVGETERDVCTMCVNGWAKYDKELREG